jgi:tRNA pseudouridine55 synthase
VTRPHKREVPAADSGSDSGLVIIDKHAGITSHDAVARCRAIFGTRRVGHAGTLDPMATGVLVIGIQRATKILGLIAGETKSYAATMRLGQTTSTDDAAGEVLRTIGAIGLTDAAITDVITAFRGEIEQVPSAVSAVKISGKRAYRLAREGHEVQLAPRTVRIDRLVVLAIERRVTPIGGFIDIDVEVDCSSGTYVRALARDAGAALGVGGHLTALRRTRVGKFGLDEAHTLDQLSERPRLSYSLDRACLLTFPHRDLTADEAEATRHGRQLAPAGIDGVYAATAPDGQVIALLRDESTRTRSVVVLRPATL